MADVLIKCPQTGRFVSTGFFSLSSPDKQPLNDNEVNCPECGKVHTWGKMDAYVK